ncbi:MAG: FecR family protein, partial [Ginsengibacter sp.]
LDKDFIDWVINPDANMDAFWNGFLLENPGQEENVLHAKKLISSFQKRGEKAPAELKERIWQSVLAGTSQPKLISMKKRRAWIAAAAIIVLLVAGYMWFYFNNSSKITTQVLAKNEIKQDIAPGGNRATLTLANGSTIILDSAQNGSLATQGNTQVVKLKDGKLIYQKENSNPASIQYNIISTPRGGQYQLTLTDGSQVWLNAASSITFPTSFVGDKREVKITGEAYFEVAHNAAMPFHVSVNKMDVEVLGTHFNVNAYDDEGMIKTTLFEGSVNVSKGNESVKIRPGQQAIVKNVLGKIQIKDDVDLEAVAAWKNGKFIFQNEDIFSIMRKLERWYNVDVTFKGNVTKEDFIGIISSKVNLSQILRLLKQTGTVKFSVIGKNVLVEEVK